MSLQCNVRHESGRCRSSQRLLDIPRPIGRERRTPAKGMLSAQRAVQSVVELLTQEGIIDQNRCIKKLQTQRGARKVTAAPDRVARRPVAWALPVVARSGPKKEQQVAREKRNAEVRSGPPREPRPTMACRGSRGWPGPLTSLDVHRFGPPGRLALTLIGVLPRSERRCGLQARQLPSHKREVQTEAAKPDGVRRGNYRIIRHRVVRTT